MKMPACLNIVCCLIVLSSSNTANSREPHSANAGHGHAGGHSTAGHSTVGHVGGGVNQPTMAAPGGGNIFQGAPNAGFRSSLQPGMTLNMGAGMGSAQNFGSAPQANFGHRGNSVAPGFQNGIQAGPGIQSSGNFAPNLVGTNFGSLGTNGIQQPSFLPNSAAGSVTTQSYGAAVTNSHLNHHRSSLQPGSQFQNQFQAPIQNTAVINSGVPANYGTNFNNSNFNDRNGNLNQQSYSASAQRQGQGGNALTQDNLIVYSGYGQGYFDRNFGVTPLYLGYGAGFGSMAFNSGYLGYNNPYLNNAQLANNGYNYNQPILANQQNPVSYQQQPPAAAPNPPAVPYEPSASTEPTRTMESKGTAQPTFISIPTGTSSATGASSGTGPIQLLLDTSVRAFKQNNFDKALNVADKGISQDPNNVVFHEFRALTLFAKGDYQPAAATMHAVLAASPGWEWNTMISVYSDVSLYTKHLRALEGTVKQNPDDGASRFLLAYHYLAAGHSKDATRILGRVVKLVPDDQVAANLLKSLQGTERPELAAQPTPQAPPMEPVEPANAIGPAKLVGVWNASRSDGSKFLLKLNADKSFTWSFTPSQQEPQSFEGTYSTTGDVMTLNRSGGGMMTGEVHANGESQFQFKLAGSPTNDPGLQFARNVSAN